MTRLTYRGCSYDPAKNKEAVATWSREIDKSDVTLSYRFKKYQPQKVASQLAINLLASSIASSLSLNNKRACDA